MLSNWKKSKDDDVNQGLWLFLDLVGGGHKVSFLRCVGYLQTNRNFSFSQELMALNPKDALNSESEESVSSSTEGLNLTQIIFLWLIFLKTTSLFYVLPQNTNIKTLFFMLKFFI